MHISFRRYFTEFDLNLHYWRLFAGKHNISATDPNQHSYHIRRVYVHPGFNTTSLENDVALVILTDYIRYSLIKEKIKNIDLIERTFINEFKLYLACYDQKPFSLAHTIEGINFGLVKMYVTLYPISWIIFTLDLVLNHTNKLLVFRWVQIVLLLLCPNFEKVGSILVSACPCVRAHGRTYVYILLEYFTC